MKESYMKYFDYDSFKDFTFISKLNALKNSDNIFCVTTTIKTSRVPTKTLHFLN